MQFAVIQPCAYIALHWDLHSLHTRVLAQLKKSLNESCVLQAWATVNHNAHNVHLGNSVGRSSNTNHCHAITEA